MRASWSVVAVAAVWAAGPAFAISPGAQVSPWTDFNKPRPAPAQYQDAAWAKVLQRLEEGELDSPPGGRAYRFVFKEGAGEPGSVRLDIAADGRATVTTKSPGQPSRSANLPNSSIEAFDAAVATAGLAAAAPAAAEVAPCPGGAPLVFEAMVEDRYRYVAEPCWTGASLRPALDVLRAY